MTGEDETGKPTEPAEPEPAAGPAEAVAVALDASVVKAAARTAKPATRRNATARSTPRRAPAPAARSGPAAPVGPGRRASVATDDCWRSTSAAPGSRLPCSTPRASSSRTASVCRRTTRAHPRTSSTHLPCLVAPPPGLRPRVCGFQRCRPQGRHADSAALRDSIGRRRSASGAQAVVRVDRVRSRWRVGGKFRPSGPHRE